MPKRIGQIVYVGACLFAILLLLLAAGTAGGLAAGMHDARVAHVIVFVIGALLVWIVGYGIRRILAGPAADRTASGR